jgi:hypothetical protein
MCVCVCVCVSMLHAAETLSGLCVCVCVCICVCGFVSRLHAADGPSQNFLLIFSTCWVIQVTM